MEGPDVIGKINEFSDLELATLLCLIAKQHCVIKTEIEALDELEQELQLVSSSASTGCRVNTNTSLRLFQVFSASPMLSYIAQITLLLKSSVMPFW